MKKFILFVVAVILIVVASFWGSNNTTKAVEVVQCAGGVHSGYCGMRFYGEYTPPPPSSAVSISNGTLRVNGGSLIIK